MLHSPEDTLELQTLKALIRKNLMYVDHNQKKGDIFAMSSDQGINTILVKIFMCSGIKTVHICKVDNFFQWDNMNASQLPGITMTYKLFKNYSTWNLKLSGVFSRN